MWRWIARVSLTAVATVVALLALHQMVLLADFARAFVPFDTSVLPAFDRHACSAEPHAPLVPRIVHQLWRSRSLADYAKTPSHAAWQRLYPPEDGWHVVLWDDDAIARLIDSRHPWLQPYYSRLSSNIQRADIARLLVLYEHGGVYADLDAPPSTRTTDRLHTLCGGALLAHGTVLVRSADGHIVTNHFMAAAPHAPFLAYALHRAISQSQALILPYLRVFYTTGPIFITRMLRDYLRSPAVAEASATRKPQEASPGDPALLANALPADLHPDAHLRDDVLLITAADAWHLVEHEGGRSWVSADGRLLNWIADNGIVPHCVAGIIALLAISAMAILFHILRPRGYCSLTNGKSPV